MRWWADLDLATPRACDAVRRAISADPSNGIALATGAWAFAIMAGEHEQALLPEAKDVVGRLRLISPNASIGAAIVNAKRFRHRRMLDLFTEGLRRAGLPE